MSKELEEVYFRLSRYFYKKGLGTYEEDVELLYKALTRPLDSELRIALSILEGLESDYEVSILGKEKEVKYTNLLRQALRLTPITLDSLLKDYNTIKQALSDKDKKIKAISYQRKICYEQITELQSIINAIEEVVNMTHMDFSRKRTNEELTGNTAMVEIKQIIGDE